MRILYCLTILWTLVFSVGLAAPEIRINIPEYSLSLYDDQRFLAAYSIAVGTPYEQTPTGQYHIFYKEEYPAWIPGSGFTDHTPVPPGPDNPLGTRWLEFKTGYGIHGTNKGWDILYPVSGGCIRMQNSDVQAIYDKVPLGTPVTITYQTLLLREKPDGLYLKILPDIYHQGSSSSGQLLQLFVPYASRYTLMAEAASLLTAATEGEEKKIAVPTLIKSPANNRPPQDKPR